LRWVGIFSSAGLITRYETVERRCALCAVAIQHLELGTAAT
jgi:hypothetical protein